MTLAHLVQLLGGVGLFLFAIRLISESLQRLAGDNMRRVFRVLTKTPFLGVLVGAGVTVLIQSSSATTVMTVSFVDAGLMTLKQAIGVIMGANVGTTVTGQLLAIKIKDYAYLFVIVGVLLGFLNKERRLSHMGSGMLGFGLLFIGMQTMEGAMDFLRTRQDIFLMFSHHPLLGLTAGMLLTLLVQSSSATVGLTIALGTQGLLPLEAAIPIVLGDNIGTTITAILASIGTSRAAKQACAAHVLFNVVGVVIFLPLMPLYMGFIQSTAHGIGHQIANAHTLFNVCNTILFLPFVGLFARLINRLIPVREKTEFPGVQFLDPKLIAVTPGIAVEAVKNECIHLGEETLKLMDAVEDVFFNDKAERSEEILRQENHADELQRAISHYSERLFRAGISDEAAKFLHGLVSSAGDLERIGDNGKKLLQLYEYRKARSRDFSSDALQGLHIMYAECRQAVEAAVGSFTQPIENTAELDALVQRVRDMEAEFRTLHIHRIRKNTCDPETGMRFVDVLGTIEQMSYRAKKIIHVNALEL